MSLNPRFCIKNDTLDWSSSSNTDDVDISALDKPFDGMTISPAALRQIVHLHYVWKTSDGARGRRADLRGATLTKEALGVVAGKLGEPGASIWAEVIASSQAS